MRGAQTRLPGEFVYLCAQPNLPHRIMKLITTNMIASIAVNSENTRSAAHLVAEFSISTKYCAMNAPQMIKSSRYTKKQRTLGNF